MTLRFGDVVRVKDLLDPQGRNPKVRPAVVVTPTAELLAGGPIFIVAVTTVLPDPLPDDHVMLPWSRPWHPRTGLNMPNAAVCRWLMQVEESQIMERMGIVPARKLVKINDILRQLDEGDE